MVNITRMPNTPPYVEGIINLRGKVIPIISMRRKFGLMDAENNSQTRVIIMDVTGELLGFTVDSVSEVIRISAGEIQPSPSVASGGIGQEYIAGVINPRLPPCRSITISNQVRQSLCSHIHKSYKTVFY